MRRTKSAPTRPLMWDFPGGHLEVGESAEDGAIRELKEESNLDAISDQLKKIGTFEESGITVHLYRLDIDDPVVRLKDGEHDQYAWTPISQMECYNLTDTIKKSVNNNKEFFDLRSIT